MNSWFSSPNQRYRMILITVLLVIIVTILIIAWTALVPFLVGAVLAYLLLPSVDFIDRHSPRLLRTRGWARPLAIILVYIAVLGIVAGILAYFIPEVGKQAEVFGKAAGEYLRDFDLQQQWEFLRDGALRIVEPLVPKETLDQLRRPLWELLDVPKAIETLLTAVQKGLRVTIVTVSQTISFILGIIIVPFWLFLVLKDAAKVRRALYDLVPEKAREDVLCIVTIIDDLLSAYVRGQLLLCLLVGLMATIALLILGVDLALLLGTVAGILEVIPVLGPYLGAIPAVLMVLLDRPMTALWVAITFAAIQQVENIFLVPRISGSAVRFHPALVMIIVVVASQVAGLWGLLLGVPIAAVLRDVFRYLYLRTTERGTTPQQALENLRARSA